MICAVTSAVWVWGICLLFVLRFRLCSCYWFLLLVMGIRLGLSFVIWWFWLPLVLVGGLICCLFLECYLWFSYAGGVCWVVTRFGCLDFVLIWYLLGFVWVLMYFVWV